jgi:hypothetical protein
MVDECAVLVAAHRLRKTDMKGNGKPPAEDNAHTDQSMDNQPRTVRLRQMTRWVGAMVAHMRSTALRWIDGLWGYDVFIAHRRIDGASYAGALSKDLEARLIRSFLDGRVYKPGDSLARETIRNARKSTLLLFVGSPASVVVRVDFGGAVRQAGQHVRAPVTPHIRRFQDRCPPRRPRPGTRSSPSSGGGGSANRSAGGAPAHSGSLGPLRL